jgi:hypothetical protein
MRRGILAARLDVESGIVELHTANDVVDRSTNDGGLDRPVSAIDLVLSFAAVLALYLALDARLQPRSIASADAAPTEFSAGRAVRVLRDVLADQAPHPAGSAEQAAVREHIVGALRGYGYQPEIQETLARGPSGRIAAVRNVLARSRGSESDRAILLCAHYDSVGAGAGAGDDGAGVAAMLEIARACSAPPRLRHDVIFLFSDAEEVGMVGASAFAEQHAWMADVAAVINLEARGSSGPCMMFEATRDNAWLVQSMARAAQRPWVTSAAETIFKNMPDDTDLAVFRARGVPGVNFAFLGEGWTNHTRLDDVAHLDLASLQQLGDATWALVRSLCDGDLREHDQGELVFADLLGVGIVRWSRSASWLLALAACVVVAATIWLGSRRGVVTVRSLAIALAVSVLTLAVCTSLGTAVIAGVNAVRGVRDAGLVQPSALRVALFTAVWLGLIACATLARRSRVGFAPLWMAAALLCSLAGLFSAVSKPETCYLFVLPALSAAFACVFSRVDIGCRHAWQVRVASWPPCLVAAVFWLPVFEAMELGFDYELGYVLAGPLSVIGLTLLPICASASPRASRAFSYSAGAACIAAISVASWVPTSSPERPRWINLRYIADCTNSWAGWEASTFGAKLPASLSSVEPFRIATAPPFAWLTLDKSMFTAPAPTERCAPPKWDRVGRTESNAGRVFRGWLRSARGASRLHVHLPPEIRLLSVAWNGHEVRDGFEDTATQLLFGLDEKGVEVEFLLRGSNTSRFWLLDQDWVLPPEAAAIQAARPAEFIPRSDGDVSIVGSEVVLE